MSTPHSSASTKPRLTVARKYALAGVGAFVTGFVLGGIGNEVSGALWIVPYADALTALGVVLALFGAAIAGSTIRQILPLGIVFGVGTFYVGESHPTHVASGWGFGFEHMTHIAIGLGLFALATAGFAVLAFYNSRVAKK